MVKTADESISAIRFCTNPKFYLPHKSYMFRLMEPLGTEINNLVCSVLGAILHLNTQNGEESMKEEKFQ